MNTESINCRIVTEIEKPGDFCWGGDMGNKVSGDPTYIYIWIPGQSGPDCIKIARGNPPGSRVWGWDGNLASPTLTPSILIPGQWHGWLRSGRLVSC